jgi:hypothetical protein
MVIVLTLFAKSTVAMELVPVVLAAGTGKRMPSLTTHFPKPLLPIGGYPMIYYPVSMLERLGFRCEYDFFVPLIILRIAKAEWHGTIFCY